MKKVATTENYNLYIQGVNEDPTFQDWATQVAGETDSNMVKIDEALNSVQSSVDDLRTTAAPKSYSITKTIAVADWVGSASPYSYTFADSNITAAANGVISLSIEATAEQREAARSAMLGIGGQSEGSLIVYADGKDKPTVDIPVTLIIIG